MTAYAKLIALQLSAKREAAHLCAFPDVVISGPAPKIHSVMTVKDIILSEHRPKLSSRNGSSHGAALVLGQAIG